MRGGTGPWAEVAGVATFAAFLLAALAIVITANDPTPGVATNLDAGGTAGFGSSWVWIVLAVGAIVGGLGLMVYAAREPAVGHGWPEAMTRSAALPEIAPTTAEGSAMTDGDTGRGSARGAEPGRTKASGLEIVTAITAFAALIVAILAFVEAAAS